MEPGAVIAADDVTFHSDATSELSTVAIADGFVDSGLAGLGMTIAVSFYQQAAESQVAGTVDAAGNLLVEAVATETGNRTRAFGSANAQPGPSAALDAVNDFLRDLDLSFTIAGRTFDPLGGVTLPQIPALNVTIGAAIGFAESENRAAAWIDDGSDIAADNVTVDSVATSAPQVSAAARAALAPTLVIGAAVVFAKLANQATSFVGYNSVVDVPQTLLIRSNALLTNPVAPLHPTITLADTDLATGLGRIAEEYGDANGVGGQVASALGPVRLFLASALADPDLMGTAYVHSAAGAAGATGVAGGLSYVDVYNLAGSGIASGAFVNQHTPGAGAGQDVEIEATATVNVLDVAGLPSALSFADGPASDVGVGGYISVLFVDNYARSYIDDLVTIDAAGDVTIDSLVHTDVLTVAETGTEAPDVAVDGAFSILVLGHESLAFIEDRANVAADAIALEAGDEGTTTNIAGGVATGNDAGVGIAGAFTMMSAPRSLQDLQPDEEEPADANDFESFGQVATAFAEGVATGVSSNELLGGSAVRAFLGDASRALEGRARGGVQGAVIAALGLSLEATSGVGLWTLAVSGADSTSTRPPLGGASTARGLDFGLGVSGDVAFSSLVNTAETYIRDVAAVAASTITLDALNATLGVTSAGALVFGDHSGISGAFARNGFFGTARSYTQDSGIETGDLAVLATSAPILLAFADSGSGARELLSLAGSVTKTDVTNLAEAFVGTGTVADVGDALVHGWAFLFGVADAGAAAANVHVGFITLGAAVNLGALINDARAFVADATVDADDTVAVKAEADEILRTVAAAQAADSGTGEYNAAYFNSSGTTDPFDTDTPTNQIGSDDLLTTAVALADLDGDGDKDLITGSFAQSTRRWLNDGSGQFVDPAALGDDVSDALISFDPERIAGSILPPLTLALAVADIDRDGDNDVVTGNFGQPNRLFLNDGEGQFGAGQGVEIGIGNEVLGTTAIALGDVNGDGWIDVIEGNLGSRTRVFLNNGGIRLQTPGGQALTFDLIVAQLPATAVAQAILGVIPDELTGPFANVHVSLDPFVTADNLTQADLLADIQAAIDAALVSVGRTAGEVVVVLGADRKLDLVPISGTVLLRDETAEEALEAARRYFADDFDVDQRAACTADVLTNCRAKDFTTSVAVGDIDGDGDLDLVIGNVGIDLRKMIEDGLVQVADLVEDATVAIEDLISSGLVTLIDLVERELLDRFDFDQNTILPLIDLINSGAASLADLAAGSIADLNSLAPGATIPAADLIGAGLVTPAELAAAGLPTSGPVPVADLINSNLVTLEELVRSGFVQPDDLVAGAATTLGQLINRTNTTIQDLIQDGIVGLQDLVQEAIDARELIRSRLADLRELIDEGLIDIPDLGDLGFDPREIASKYAVGAPSRVYINVDNPLTAAFEGFAAPADLESRVTKAIALAKINNDDFLDVVTANVGTPVRAYLGNGAGGFGPGTDLTSELGLISTSLVVTDLDGDGDNDLVVGNLFETNRAYLNNGAGSFGPSSAIGADRFATTSIAVADIDGDNLPDVVAGNSLPSIGLAGSVSWTNLVDRAAAEIREDATVKAGRSVLVEADGTSDVVALAGAAASAADASVGAAVNYTHINHDVLAAIDDAEVTAGARHRAEPARRARRRLRHRLGDRPRAQLRGGPGVRL